MGNFAFGLYTKRYFHTMIVCYALEAYYSENYLSSAHSENHANFANVSFFINNCIRYIYSHTIFLIINSICTEYVYTAKSISGSN
jgi:hypothetical protein